MRRRKKGTAERRPPPRGGRGLTEMRFFPIIKFISPGTKRETHESGLPADRGKGEGTAMLWKYIFILFPAGILAGITSSVAGLASLVSYPALLLAGIPPVSANVTNTVALIFTALGSGAASKRELRGHGREVLKLLPLTVGGSLCGGALLLAAPSSSFEHVVPFFILSAALVILWPELHRARLRGKPEPGGGQESPAGKQMPAAAVWAAIFFVGAYAGYFGAAAGVVMLAILAATTRLEFAEYNALKNVSLGASNLVATFLFIFRADICWQAVPPLAAGFFIGGFIGPHIVRRVPKRPLKIGIAVAATAFAAYLFVQTYFWQS